MADNEQFMWKKPVHGRKSAARLVAPSRTQSHRFWRDGENQVPDGTVAGPGVFRRRKGMADGGACSLLGNEIVFFLNFFGVLAQSWLLIHGIQPQPSDGPKVLTFPANFSVAIFIANG